MIATFSRSGITIRYPTNWQIDTDDAGDGGWTVTLQSPETAFLMVSLRPDANDPAQVADEALEVLRAEYKELDADHSLESLAGRPAIGYDIDFLTVDTSIVCWTRCLETPEGPLLLLCQTSEFDRATHEPVLRAICSSLKVEPD